MVLPAATLLLQTTTELTSHRPVTGPPVPQSAQGALTQCVLACLSPSPIPFLTGQYVPLGTIFVQSTSIPSPSDDARPTVDPKTV